MNPRLSYCDTDNAAIALADANEHIIKLTHLIAAEPKSLLQTRYSSLASDYESIAWFSYALGFPIAEVRSALCYAVSAYLKVFELRGTAPQFPVYKFQYDPSYSPGIPESTIEFKQLHDNDKVDYSLTNSQKGYVALCEALIVGEDLIVEKLSTLIWDPPNATYIGPRSFCTPNDQHLAYAMRELLYGDIASMLSELAALKTSRQDVNIAFQATMLQALAMNDPSNFIRSIAALLCWHEKEAVSRKNYRNPEFFICTPGLALCKLALQRQICTIEDLPNENVFLPLKLIDRP